MFTTNMFGERAHRPIRNLKIEALNECLNGPVTSFTVDPEELDKLYPTEKKEKPKGIGFANIYDLHKKPTLNKVCENAVDIYFKGGDWKGYIKESTIKGYSEVRSMNE